MHTLRNCLVVVTLALGLQSVGSPPLHAEAANRIVLRVNDRITTLYDYRQRLADSMRALRASGLDPQERQRQAEQLPQQVMKSMFDELLILSRGDQMGVVPSELDIDDAVNRMKERAGVESDEQFRAALAQSGMTIEDLRAQAERQLVWDEVLGREMLPRVTISDDELRDYYEDHIEEFGVPAQIEVKEIVVLSEESPVTEEARTLARDLRERLAAGETFEEVVEAHRPRVSDVIDVGWVGREDLADPLADALWELGAGELSEPVEARGGLHIARVTGRKDSTVIPFEDVKGQIQRVERQRRYVEEVEVYLAELEEKSLIIGNVPEEAAGFRTASGTPLEGDQQPFTVRAASPEGEIEEPADP